MIGSAALGLSLLPGAHAQGEIRTGEVDGYRFRLFVAETEPPPSGRPLLVVLHGCEQSAEDMVLLTGFDVLAAEHGLAVLYPETDPSTGNPYGCWRWWAPVNQIRSGGDPEIIVNMVTETFSATRVDRKRVYAVGLSSGGAMSAVLGALYPEVFAAVGVHSGMPYAAASTATCALRAMSGGTWAAESAATIAYNAQGRQHRSMPLMVIQGSQDEVVAPENAARLVQQFAQLNDMADDGDGSNQSIDAVADSTREDRIADGRPFRIRIYHDAGGEEIMREVMVDGMGHAWSGGPPDTEFSDPGGPDATSLYWSFFRDRSMNTPPLKNRKVAECSERYGSNFAHFWWFGRMSLDEYRCDPWRWSWRRGYDGKWIEGRCP
ncbi:MAG TPA: PHB depolymerase family esterase [Gammaproteobacteria bacterium]|nr:PHB depolymerase family esterase [Gammaproteobacteria bacterium]